MPEIRINGTPVRARAGTTVLAALRASGHATTCASVTGEPRGGLCGMGVCMECHALVNGRTARTCLTPVADNLDVTTLDAPNSGENGARSRHAAETGGDTRPPATVDVLVIGAGPAGLEAAVAAGSAGVRVAVLDLNGTAGGQIWRGAQPATRGAAGALLRHLQGVPNVTLHQGVQVAAVTGARSFLVTGSFGAAGVSARAVILATGAHEVFVPFPGWTLPNVTGAAALQAMLKGGLDVRGKRVLVAGTGPLLLIVARDLRAHGAHVIGVAEQATARQLLPFARALARHPSKLAQGLALRARLSGTPYWTGAYPVRATGTDRVRHVTLRRGSRAWTREVDYLAVGFGLAPDTRLASALGCDVWPNGAVRVDAAGLTSVPGVYAAGEITGVGGADKARLEGRAAGWFAAAQTERGARLLPRVAAARAFADALGEAFRLRSDVRKLPEPDTFVCRCEDVTHAALAARSGWVDAKLHTRCGMGACQGRVCGGATSFLYGWGHERGRAPLFPTRIQDLLEEA